MFLGTIRKTFLTRCVSETGYSHRQEDWRAPWHLKQSILRKDQKNYEYNNGNFEASARTVCRTCISRNRRTKPNFKGIFAVQDFGIQVRKGTQRLVCAAELGSKKS